MDGCIIDFLGRKRGTGAIYRQATAAIVKIEIKWKLGGCRWVISGLGWPVREFRLVVGIPDWF